jgi:hypothetical protein
MKNNFIFILNWEVKIKSLFSFDSNKKITTTKKKNTVKLFNL